MGLYAWEKDFFQNFREVYSMKDVRGFYLVLERGE